MVVSPVQLMVRAGPGCPNAVRDASTDADIRSSLEILNHLAVRELSVGRYCTLYRDIISRLARILPAGQLDMTRPDAVERVTQDSGLAAFDGLELDQEALDFITQVLLATQTQ